jgi:hypothetical protein
VLKRSAELLTFAALSDTANPFGSSIEQVSCEAVRTTELLATPDGRRNFVELLNRNLYRYLESRALLVDTF